MQWIRVVCGKALCASHTREVVDKNRSWQRKGRFDCVLGCLWALGASVGHAPMVLDDCPDGQLILHTSATGTLDFEKWAGNPRTPGCQFSMPYSLRACGPELGLVW
ncbi:unnamed protein product [Ostreobium quekettii]|uniref:Uncharacterized protein n=1 Tax=Ostreobium quekettii TaxID=121088 RepID=A0A8S1IXJ0_9CHLO|nr:unnamed protein product [Ostreobium quekettii]